MNNIHKLRKVYCPRFDFPKWVDDFAKTEYYDICAKRTLVFYDKGDNLSTVKKLTLQREPVNIGMKTRYNKTLMKKYFGWTFGAYGDIVKKYGIVNIAIYCYTPFLSKGKTVYIHLINSIGLAQDSPEQPDFKQLVNNKGKLNVSKYTRIFKRVIKKIYVCFKELRNRGHRNLKTIMFTGIGMSAFSGAYSTDVKLIFTQVFGEFLRKTLKERKKLGIWCNFLSYGKKNRYVTKAYNLVDEDPMGIHVVGDIATYPFTLEDPESVLFVNAWDPWSFAGNGNAVDNSLDGQIGRRSAIACLCSPLTNEYITDRNYIEV